MDGPDRIDSVYWDSDTKSWRHKEVTVQEYHGFTECQRCGRPMSHNVKSDGEFKVVYVECACSKR